MNATPNTDKNKSLEDELLDLLASQARKVMIPAFVVSATIASFAAPFVAKLHWIAWLVAVFLILLTRRIVIPLLATTTTIKRRDRLNIIVLLSFLHGSIQGYSLTFFPQMGILQQSMHSMLMAGLCMAAVVTSGGYLPFFLAFVLPIMLPLSILWITSLGGSGLTQLDVGVALSIFLFFAVLVSVARDTYQQFRKSHEDRRKLREAMDSKTRFLATASHDLRQPMQALSASIESLDHHALDDSARSIVTDLHTAKEDLSDLLRALLDISRLDAGVEDLEKTDFSLYRLLFAVADEQAPGARDKGLELKFDCPENAAAHTNPTQLKRIVSNLVENAVRYTASGSVQIRCGIKGDRNCIEIADTGIGIARQDLDTIFEDFHQLGGPARSHKRTGLGLGLSIVRRLVEQLGLDLDIESEPGRGSVFSVSVPKATKTKRAKPENTGIPFEFPGLRVVVVDDEADVATALQKMLQSIGCSVRTADGTETVLGLVQQQVPDVLLVDRRLKDGDDGLLLIDKVRQIFPALPAVLISGDTAPDRILEAKNAGIPALVKPAGLEEIKRSIAQACS